MSLHILQIEKKVKYLLAANLEVLLSLLIFKNEKHVLSRNETRRNIIMAWQLFIIYLF